VIEARLKCQRGRNPQFSPKIIRNEDIKQLIVETPEGHKHLSIGMVLQDGRKLIFQEATVANLVRAYIAVKTHPTIEKVKPSAPFHKYGNVSKGDGAHVEGVDGGRRRPPRGSAESRDEQKRDGAP